VSSSIDRHVECEPGSGSGSGPWPGLALACGVLEFVSRWREAFLPEHDDYRGGDPGMDPLGVIGPVDHASSCLCSRIEMFEEAARGTYDADVSLKVIRQCVAELWATQGRIWTSDIRHQFDFGDDGRAVVLPNHERPDVDVERRLKTLETHAARLLLLMLAEREPTTPSEVPLRRETPDEQRDRYCYEERRKGRAWNPILEELKEKWPGDEFNSGTAAKKAANRYARREGIEPV
jgi:hypothetical protein